jgi:hypothetical protein
VIARIVADDPPNPSQPGCQLPADLERVLMQAPARWPADCMPRDKNQKNCAPRRAFFDG